MEIEDQLVERIMEVLIGQLEESQRVKKRIAKAIWQLKDIARNYKNPQYHVDTSINMALEHLEDKNEI